MQSERTFCWSECRGQFSSLTSYTTNHLLRDTTPCFQQQGPYCPHTDSNSRHTTCFLSHSPSHKQMPSLLLIGPKRGWEDGINVYVVGGGGDIDWMYLAEGEDEWQHFMKTVMNIRWTTLKILPSRATINCPEALCSTDTVMPCMTEELCSA